MTMCTSVSNNLLPFCLVATLAIQIMCGSQLLTDGLPRPRWERGADPDILAGADFLSVFMGTSLRRAFRETTTQAPATLSFQDYQDIQETQEDITKYSPFIRTSRSTSNYDLQTMEPEVLETTTLSEETTTSVPQELSSSSVSNLETTTSDSSVILGVRVSTSVGRTFKRQYNRKSKVTTTEFPDQSYMASEEHPSIIAEANKSEFNVEEPEPITSNSDLLPSEYNRPFPANVQPLPRSHTLPSFEQNPSFLDSQKDKFPYHQTVIYHNNQQNSNGARSVSYSTVIQSLPQTQTEKTWEEIPQHERHERHYNQPFKSNYNILDSKPVVKLNDTVNAYSQQSTESANYYPTSRPERSDTVTPKNWQKEENNHPEDLRKLQTTERSWKDMSKSQRTPPSWVDLRTSKTTQPTWEDLRKSHTTERNWEMEEKVYRPSAQKLPKVYGQPEQNYEVDEAVSVLTNGRAHGIQPQMDAVTKPEENKESDNNKKDDNQKVGYVVEGRKFRKYRLEERTSDGFIVGEYGVVNHDDGSLRGVRYTADGTINPRLIYDALMKFLSL